MRKSNWSVSVVVVLSMLLVALGSPTGAGSSDVNHRSADTGVLELNPGYAQSQTAPTAYLPRSENVELVGQVGGRVNAVAVQGNHVYLGVGPRLLVLDVSDPTTPILAGQTPVLPDVQDD